MIALAIVGLAVSPILAPATWPAGWERELAAHFGDAPPVRPPDDAVDELIEQWVRSRPTGLDVLLDARWQGSDVYLLDAQTLARIDARIDLHALFPFAGTDAGGHRFAMRAALLGRGRFAFVYDAPIELHLPPYGVLGRDAFSLAALDLGLLATEGLRGLKGFDAPGKPRSIDGPWGVALARVTREGELMRVRTRIGQDVRVRALHGEPRALVAKGETMRTVTSPDGTKIAFAVSGSGPSLVLVHGTTADHARWTPILPALEKHFTVYAVDCRGRGGSGDGKSYAFEREFEDLVAVVDSLPQPVLLLGHSYGAIVALEAALRSKNVVKLVLYEPPIPMSRAPLVPNEMIEKLEALLEKGDRDGVVTAFFRDVVHMPPAELGLVQKAPSWKARVAAAHTIPREERGSNGYVFPSARLTALKTPTLLLLGGDSPPFLRAPTMALKDKLPSAKLSVMPGQQHVAINTAPDLFAREVIDFLAPDHTHAK